MQVDRAGTPTVTPTRNRFLLVSPDSRKDGRIADEAVPFRLEGLPIGKLTDQLMLKASEPRQNTRSCFMASSAFILVVVGSGFSPSVFTGNG